MARCISACQARLDDACEQAAENMTSVHQHRCASHLVAGSRMSVSGTQARSRVGRGSPRLVLARRLSAANRCGRSSCPVTCRTAFGLGQ